VFTVASSIDVPDSQTRIVVIGEGNRVIPAAVAAAAAAGFWNQLSQFHNRRRPFIPSLICLFISHLPVSHDFSSCLSLWHFQ
jgi:bifunctional DNase/RNase